MNKYGMRFPEGVSEEDIELWCYAHDKRGEGEGGRLSAFEHFRNYVDMMWNVEGSTRRVIWNEWNERMIRAFIGEKYVSLAGSASSGKSDAAALWGMVEWLAAPAETLVLVTSTTLGGARKRVWKSVTELWNWLEARWKEEGKVAIGNMVQSRGILCGMDGNGMWSEGMGMTLIPAEQASENEAAKKLKGLKAPAGGKGRLRLIADELPDIGRSVLVAGLGNLNTNPDFKMVGLGNPISKTDPFGEFSQPEGGWGSVSVMDNEWRTRVGVCLRFNALESPAIKEEGGEEKYPWFPSRDSIEQFRGVYGENSREFWAQFLGMWPPDGASGMVWSENELMPWVKDEGRVIEWDGETVMVGGFDPSFTSGGDRAVFVWGRCGRVRGVKKLQVLGYRVFDEGLGEVDDDGKLATVSYALIGQLKAACASLGIRADRMGVDNTGGGVVFCQWLQKEWSAGFRRVNFGGKAMERVVGMGMGEEVYGDRLAQLWCQPKPMVREGQILDIPREIVAELCERKFSDTKTSGGKLWLESKKDMKKRMGRSCDLADGFVVLVETCIMNGLLDFREVRDVRKVVVDKFRKEMGNVGRGGKILLANLGPKHLVHRR